MVLYVPDKDGSEGIVLTYYKSSRRLEVSGFYDHIVQIPGETFGLREFFDRLGITKGDCLAVFNNVPTKRTATTTRGGRRKNEK